MRNFLRTCYRHSATFLLLASAPFVSPSTSPAAAPIPGFVNCDVPVDASPSAIVAGDFDSDGSPDLAVVDASKAQVLIVLTDKGHFAQGDCAGAAARTSTVPLSGVALAIAAGDLDQNGTVDLAVVVLGGVSILSGDGAGGFQAEAPRPAGSGPTVVAIADVDGDGQPDLIVGNGFGNSVSILYGCRSCTGGFENPSTTPINAPVTSIVVSNFNKDGFNDIATASNSGNQLAVLLQIPEAPRTFRSLSPIAATAPGAMALGDFDGNAAPDLAATSASTVSVFLNQLPANETTPFVQVTPAPSDRPALTSLSAIGVSDFNDDLAADVVVADAGTSTVTFFLGDGRGGLTEQPDVCTAVDPTTLRCTVGHTPRALTLADVDGDGHDDVITANDGGSLSVLLSSRPAATPSATPTATPTMTPTVPDTATPTQTQIPTITPAITPTMTPTRTLTPVPTATFGACIGGGVCVQGPGCAITRTPPARNRGMWLWPAAILWIIRSRRWAR